MLETRRKDGTFGGHGQREGLEIREEETGKQISLGAPSWYHVSMVTSKCFFYLPVNGIHKEGYTFGRLTIKKIK